MVAEVARVLRLHRFNYRDEGALQKGIGLALNEAGAPFTREFHLDRYSRIDFQVHAKYEVGIEVKINGAASAVARQIRRYMASPLIHGLVLVTTRRRHRAIVDESFDKPLEIVWLGLSGL